MRPIVTGQPWSACVCLFAGHNHELLSCAEMVVDEPSGVVGRGRGGTAPPHLFRQGGRVPHFPHFFD